MYGYLRPDGGQGRRLLFQYQCGLCRHLGSEYRLRARFAAGFDPSLLAMLIDGLQHGPARRLRVPCPIPLVTARWAVDPDWVPLHAIAALHLFLLGEKLVDDRRDREGTLAKRAATLRDWSYCWERLETSPPVLGVPEGERGWIYALNTFNLLLALAALWLLANPNFNLIEGAWAPIALGWVPLAFSALVFIVPSGRALARSVLDRARLRRNAWRVVLLGLFHVLEERERIDADGLAKVLFDTCDFPQKRHLDRLLARAVDTLEGTIDEEAGVGETGLTYRFERVHRELGTIERARIQVDLGALSLSTIVYDTAKPD